MRAKRIKLENRAEILFFPGCVSNDAPKVLFVKDNFKPSSIYEKGKPKIIKNFSIIAQVSLTHRFNSFPNSSSSLHINQQKKGSPK
jgi:hypothetical protein